MFEVEDEVEAERAAMAARLARMSAVRHAVLKTISSQQIEADWSLSVLRVSFQRGKTWF